jgi:D-serine deaminase-like pyridoxal phosphate-dependent protein
MARPAHDPYFAKLSAALKEQGLMRPTLVIDQERLDQNIETVTSHLPADMGLRIVVKSLPSVPLVKHVMELAKTDRLMVFDMPFLSAVARDIPQADVLFGKPMPVTLARQFYDDFKGGNFSPSEQVQWLIDTPERLSEYAKLAEERDLRLKVNIEIDVGLHRGGVSKPEQLKAMLDEIDANPRLSFGGLMGYDAHVAKVPGILRGRAERKSKAIYKEMRDICEERYPGCALTFNTGGSPTYQMHEDLSTANEVAVGSALVKPLDFDVATLKDHVPASFISTPVLKAEDKTLIPGMEALSGISAIFNPKAAKTYFIYGGNWQAEPVSPPGLKQNKLYGRSSNEEMLNGPRGNDLKVDDLVFLRPTQSEFVFLQFGDIAVYNNGKITDFWPVIEQEPKKLKTPKPQAKPQP